jgi:3-oxoacyl-[acyl-carrier-protein] synthase III
MTIGIKKITVYRPTDSVDNLTMSTRFNVSNDFISNKIGMLSLARLSKEQDTTDLAQSATIPLFDKFGLKVEQVECLVFVTQNPDKRGLPHSSAILHNKLDLPSSCAVFDISLGCSGFVQGLSITKSFMESQGFSNGILVTADPYSKIINPEDRDTAMLFGDGATASWLSDTPIWEIGAFDFGIDSNQRNALTVDTNNCLTMNGRAVFNFAVKQVPPSIDRVLGKASLTMDQIDMVLLHQGSKYIVETLARRLGAFEKAPFLAVDYGNTVSSSIPMLLAEQVPESAKRILLSGFGVGLAWATCILEKAKC